MEALMVLAKPSCCPRMRREFEFFFQGAREGSLPRRLTPQLPKWPLGPNDAPSSGTHLCLSVSFSSLPFFRLCGLGYSLPVASLPAIHLLCTAIISWEPIAFTTHFAVVRDLQACRRKHHRQRGYHPPLARLSVFVLPKVL